MVADLVSFYNTEQRKFYSLVSLGRNTCGYKRITHGGMTAAIVDESFGGLLLALRQSKALPFWGPAFTASLEVSYKAVRRLAQHSAILLTNSALSRSCTLSLRVIQVHFATSQCNLMLLFTAGPLHMLRHVLALCCRGYQGAPLCCARVKWRA